MSSNEVQKYIPDIENAAKFFEEHFVNKELIYSSKEQSISIKFKRHQFMHLCGITYLDGSNEFFNAALAKKLDIKKMKMKTDGSTQLKLSILRSINFLISDQIQLTNEGIYLKLRFDKGLRTNKLLFALTLKFDGSKELYPNSLLKLKNKDFPIGKKVISVKAISLVDNSVITYI